ncbi:MAG: GspE/PulE family protein [Fuerstiella sp.]
MPTCCPSSETGRQRRYGSLFASRFCHVVCQRDIHQSGPSTISTTAQNLRQSFSTATRELDPTRDDYVPALINLMLATAREHRASDVHLVPAEERLLMQWRIDGVLHSVAGFDPDLTPRLIARLKVLAGLLTYRTDVPQEGRISASADSRNNDGEVRVTTFPTLFGEKAAVRLFAGGGHYQHLQDLGLPPDVEQVLQRRLQATSGVILLTGPSGSGKTTTVYACLRELVSMFGDGKGLMTVEDPIEVVLPGVTQSQVRLNVGFDLATGLKAMMRQDPDVIMVGEIRDPETAECAFQAALTGHLVLTTFHAGSSVEAVTRLLDMGIEPYLLRSTLQAVVCQRLLRRACDVCGLEPDFSADGVTAAKLFELSDKTAAADVQSSGCSRCGGLRYHGRFVTAEVLDPNRPEIARGILERVDSRTLQSIAAECGTVTLRERAQTAVQDKLTWPAEVFRVLGTE